MYGLTYRVPVDSTVVVVPVGYADGLPRAAGTAGAELLVVTAPRPIAGVVGMEQTVLDATRTCPAPATRSSCSAPARTGS